MMGERKTSRRIHFIDEVRGFAIVLMVAYHGFYTAGYLFDWFWGRALLLFFLPVEPFFAGVFIFICGMSCRLSHSNLKRSALLLLIALTITLVLWIFLPEEIILFGILHFLAVAILLFALLKPLLDRIPVLLGLVLCGILLLVTWWVPTYQGSLFGIKGLIEWPVPEFLNQNWLFPLGFSDTRSSDYFPILPWVFCFMGGSFAGIWAVRQQLPEWMYRQRVPVLSKAGHYTLIIYILHQPVIYALCFIGLRIIQR